MNSDYTPIIGLEVHVELNTASKMFCGCKNDPFHALKPNMYTCPVCLGMPGALPVPNKKAIEWTITLGLALGCKINLFSHFDRKHYFYPDLPKGYQISQYDQPFCVNGKLETEGGVVRIHRIHLEEDTGKLLHKTVNNKKVSLIDFNRSGVPLVEIVSEADIRSASQAKAYAKALRTLLRYLDIADCDMEQGGMRLEANISLGEKNTFDKNGKILQFPPYKVEVKNINSFRFLEHAVEYEIKRHENMLSRGETPVQETRGWSEDRGESFSQRTKEEAADYRYFPDPDIPPIVFEQKMIDEIKNNLPELPSSLVARWQKEFGVEERFGRFFVEDQQIAQKTDTLFQAARAEKLSANTLANMLVNKKLVDADKKTLSIEDSAVKVLAAFKNMSSTDEVDESELHQIIEKIMAENSPAVEDYRSGKTQVLGFFMGQVQRSLGKKIDSQTLKTALESRLSLPK